MQQQEHEQIFIEQYLAIRINKLQKDVTVESIVDLPIGLLRYGRQIFRRQRKVDGIVLDMIRQQMYMKQVSSQLVSRLAEEGKHYWQLMNAIPTKDLFLSQLVVRLVMLSLSNKLSIPGKIYSIKFNYLIRCLQTQLLFTNSQSPSEMLITRLDKISLLYYSLDFYQELQQLVQKADLHLVNKWTQQQIKNIRNDWENKNKNIVQLKEPTQHKQKSTIPISIKKQKIIFAVCKDQNYAIRNKTVSKKQNELQKNDTNLSPITHANKMRCSVSRIIRPSGKYFFKSTKKIQSETQQIEYYDSNGCDAWKAEGTKMEAKKQPTDILPPDKTKLVCSDQQPSNMLCPATPPRHNKQHN